MPRKKREADRTEPSPEYSDALEIYRREKARRSMRKREIDERLAAAQRQYDALLANEAASGRGGRPKKIVTDKKNAPERSG